MSSLAEIIEKRKLELAKKKLEAEQKKKKRKESKELDDKDAQESPRPRRSHISTVDYTKEIQDLRNEIELLKKQIIPRSETNLQIAEFKRIALEIAEKYARSKSRWFIDPKNPLKGLNPKNSEKDKLAYQRLIELGHLF